MNTGATLHLVLMIILTPISVGAMVLVTRWFVAQKNETEQAQRVNEIWAHRAAWGETICRQLINHEIAPGMTPAMVSLAWGEPQAITPLSAGLEEWVYQSGHQNPQSSSIIFKDGLVVEQKGERPAKAGLIANPWVVIAISIGLALMVSAVTLIVVFAVG